jgi:hypothetical protein
MGHLGRIGLMGRLRDSLWHPSGVRAWEGRVPVVALPPSTSLRARLAAAASETTG